MKKVFRLVFPPALLALAGAYFLWPGSSADDRLPVHAIPPSGSYSRVEPAPAPDIKRITGDTSRQLEDGASQGADTDMSSRQRAKGVPMVFAMAMNLPDSDERRQAMKKACVEIAEQDPQEALCLLVEHELWDEQEGLLENFTAQWAARDPVAARDWVRRQPAGVLRNDLIARVAFVQSQAEPVEAARLVVEQIPPGEAQAEAIISVLHQWARRDEKGATAWIESFQPGALRDRALAELASVRQAADVGGS